MAESDIFLIFLLFLEAFYVIYTVGLHYQVIGSGPAVGCLPV